MGGIPGVYVDDSGMHGSGESWREYGVFNGLSVNLGGGNGLNVNIGDGKTQVELGDGLEVDIGEGKTKVSMGNGGLEVNIGEGELEKILQNAAEEVSEDGLLKGQKDLEAFDSVYMDVELGDIEITLADSYKIQYQVWEEADFTYEVKDGVLTVSLKKQGSEAQWKNKKIQVFLYVPQDAILDRIELNQSCGDVVLRQIEAGEIVVDSSLGDVSSDQVKGRRLYVDSSLGDVEVSGLDEGADIEQMEIYSSCGDVEIQTTLEYGMDLQASCGEITVDGAKEQVQTGLMSSSYKQDSDSGRKIVCDSGLGNIQIRK